MKINAIRIDADYLVKALNNLGVLVRAQEPSLVLVMQSCKVNKLVENLIYKQLILKEESSKDIQELIGYYSGAAKVVLSDATQIKSYLDLVEHTITALSQTLLEGSLFKMDTRSLVDYALANAGALSARLVASFLNATTFIDGRELIVSDDNFGDAVINWADTTTKVSAAFAIVQRTVVVSAGFGMTPQGYTTSLGRGGFDLFTTTLGSILKCEEINIYTYQNGIYNADPAIVSEATSLETITYQEAAQLSFTGNSAIYPPAIWPAVKVNIPIVIKNILDPSFKGTYISHKENAQDANAISGITHICGLNLITVYGNGLLGQIGTSSKLFGLLSENGINIMFISQSSSEYSISFAVAEEDGKKAVDAISKARKNKQFLTLDESVYVKKNVSIVSVCGNKMRNVPGISGKLFSVLGNAKVNIIATAQGGEELNISIVIDQKDVKKAVEGIFAAFLG